MWRRMRDEVGKTIVGMMEVGDDVVAKVEVGDTVVEDEVGDTGVAKGEVGKTVVATILKTFPVMHRHQCALCEARNQWLFRCEAPSCGLLVCADCIGDLPRRPGVQRCVRCFPRR
jgi:hypothetical protein